MKRYSHFRRYSSAEIAYALSDIRGVLALHRDNPASASYVEEKLSERDALLDEQMRRRR